MCSKVEASELQMPHFPKASITLRSYSIKAQRG